MKLADPAHEIAEYLDATVQSALALKSHSSTIAAIGQKLIDVVLQNGTIYSCGNGGSACDSMHFTEELVGIYEKRRRGIRAQHFHDPGMITCWANDVGYDSLFERCAETFCTDKDALVVFTTSGKSPNILKAIAAAKARGCATIALLGKGGGPAKGAADLELIVDSNRTSHVQECHIKLVHMLCGFMERAVV